MLTLIKREIAIIAPLFIILIVRLTNDLLGIDHNDPNIIYNSTIAAYYSQGFLIGPSIGINKVNQFNLVPIYNRKDRRFGNNDRLVFLDVNHHLLVYCSGFAYSNQLSRARVEEIITYIGPGGFSTTPDKDLGQFDQLIATSYRNTQLERDLMLVFDSRQKCFLRIDPENQTIETGPPLPADFNSNPLQIKDIGHHGYARIFWNFPDRTILVPDLHLRTIEMGPDIREAISYRFPTEDPNVLPILTDNGSIYNLDTKTLQITDLLGNLPHPDSPHYQSLPIRPDQLYDWEIMPVFYKNQYRGLATASFDRSASNLTIAVFDHQGQHLTSGVVDRIQALLYTVGFGPLSKLGKYITETLHPPVLTVASYFTSETFPVDNGFNTLFLIPNSYAATGLNARGILLNFIICLVVMCPAVIVAICLASLIARDANRRGLPKSVIKYWIVAAVAFGFTAYLTYRFTRPTITQVNCANCGRPRRPDQDQCHHCDAPWSLPQLNSPTWRIIDS